LAATIYTLFSIFVLKKASFGASWVLAVEKLGLETWIEN